MFHKIKNVSPLPDFKLSVQFCEGVTKLYDVKPLFKRLPVFVSLKEHPAMASFGMTSWIYPATNCGSTV